MKKTIIFMIAIVLVLVAGCSKDESSKKNKKNDNEVEEKVEKSTGISPLTGLNTDEGVNQRIVGIMVNNHPKARPQSGLSKADIVFEVLAEGNITRFLALFQSEQPDVVGPVRSAREYYFELANGYDALYVYHGAAGFINDMIVERGIDYLNGAKYDNDGHLFKRESFREAPHNSYLQFSNVYDVAEENDYATTFDYQPLPFLTDEESEAVSGDPAKHIQLTYTPLVTVEYDYNEDSGKYSRFSDGEQTVELDNGNPIEVENVLIVETEHQIIDDEGRRSVDLVSGGNAYLLQKGTVQKLQWEQKDGKIIPVKDGIPVGFVPGKTWINIIPTNPGLEEAVIVTNE